MRVIRFYKHKWGIQLSQEHLTLDIKQLEQILSHKANEKLKYKSALKIQTATRRFICRIKYLR